MEKGTSKNSEISPRLLKSFINNPSLLKDSDDFTKYIVAKCLSNDISRENEIIHYIKKLEKTECYKYFLSLKNIQYKTVLTQSNYINELTRGFVGREYVFDSINNFLKKETNGYFIIVGDPGEGKSAILSEYVRRTKCVSYFNIRVQGINRTGQCIESICSQLISRYCLSHTSPDSDTIEDGVFFQRILNEVSELLNEDEQVVIAIDALDELDLTNHPSGANILFLARQLPQSVFFIMSKRDISLPLVTYSPQHTFDLRNYRKECLKDVQTFIECATKLPQIIAWIENNKLDINDFISALAQKSEYNFMYLKYVLPEIESGVYHQLKIEKLPIGLKGYYEDHWIGMGMASKPTPHNKIKIIYILAEVLQPISRQLISEFANVDQITVQEVLDDWHQFLHKQEVDEQARYSFYHTSFHDFLHRKDIVRALGVLLKDINTLIAGNLWYESPAEISDLRDRLSGLSSERQDYILRNLTAHLIKAKEIDRLYKLLTNIDFIEAKVEEISVYELFINFTEALKIIPNDHSYGYILKLLKEAIGRDIQFIARHPTTLFQCLWNTCWWYDCPEASKYYDQEKTEEQSSKQDIPKLHGLMELWRTSKERNNPGFFWIRSLSPPVHYLGSSQILVIQDHNDIVLDVKFSPDGKYIASGSCDNTWRLWNTRNGKQTHCLKAPEGRVNCVAFSPDGRYIACGYESVYLFTDIAVIIWDVETGKQLKSIKGHYRSVLSISFSADGKRIVTGSRDNIVRVWDLENGDQLLYIEGHRGPVKSVAFSPDGKYILSAGHSYDVERRDRKRITPSKDSSDSKDSHIIYWRLRKLIAKIYGGEEDKEIQLQLVMVWDAMTGKQLFSLEGHEDEVDCVTFSQNGKYIACAADSIRVYDPKSGLELKCLKTFSEKPTCITFSPDGRYIACGYRSENLITPRDRQKIDIWDIEKEQVINCFEGHTEHINSLDFYPDGRYIVSGSNDNTIRIWDAKRKSETRRLKDNFNNINSAIYSPNGKYIIIGKENTIRILDAENLEQVKCLKEDDLSISASGESIAVSSDCQCIAAGDEKLATWHIKTGNKLFCSKETLEGIFNIAFSPNGHFLACFTLDLRLYIWDLIKGKLLKSIIAPFIPSKLTISQDNRFVIVFYFGNYIRIWDIEKGQELRVTDENKPSILSIAFSPNSERIATGTYEKKILIWDAVGKKKLSSIKTAEFPIELAFTSDNKCIACKFLKNKGGMWEVESGKYIKEIDCPGRISAIIGDKSETKFEVETTNNESGIINTTTGLSIAWIPISSNKFSKFSAHPLNRKWITVTSGFLQQSGCLQIFSLEGDSLKQVADKEFFEPNYLDSRPNPIIVEMVDNKLKSGKKAEKVGRSSKKAEEYFRAAKQHYRKGNYEASEQLYQRAIGIWSKTNGSNIGEIIGAQLRLADLLFYKKNEYTKAKEAYKSAAHSPLLWYFGKEGARVVNNLAFIYTIEKRWEEAQYGFYQAYLIQKELDDQLEAADAIGNWAMCRVEQGDYKVAEPILKQMMKIMADNNDKRERKARYYLAKIAAAQEKLNVAIEHQSRAVQISEIENDSQLEKDLIYLKELKMLLKKINCVFRSE